MSVLFYLLAGISGQRPDHSIFIAATQLPLEARVGGIFSGVLLGLCYFALIGRARSLLYPGGWIALVLLGFIAILVLDGFNALFYDLGRPHLYQPSNPLRLATGLLTGYALAAFSLPSVASVLWREGELEAPLEHIGELLAGIAPLALFWLLAVADLAAMLYPVALIYTAGVLIALAEANLYLTGLVRRWAATRWKHAGLALALGVGLGIPELLALRGLRAWLFDAFGVTWVG